MNTFDRSRLLTRLQVRQPVKELLYPITNPARQAHNWAHIAARLDRQPRARANTRSVITLLACACVFALVGLELRARWSRPAPQLAAAREPASSIAAAPPPAPKATRELRLVGGAEFKRLAFEDSPSASGEQPSVLFEDGSQLKALSAGTLLEVLAMTEREVTLRLASGSIDFQVAKGGPRKWLIEAGELRVEVVGTRFVVTRTPELTHIAVTEGSVLLRSPDLPDGVQRLVAGESQQVGVAKPVTKRRNEGNFDSLLHDADTARRRGDLHTASARLKQLLTTFPDDAQSGVIAFQLALVTQQMGAPPASVVAAFETALTKARGQSLRQDCLWRLVLALEHAGQTEQAKQRAAESLGAYPNGRYASQLKHRVDATPSPHVAP